jgi:hypothetical protein
MRIAHTNAFQGKPFVGDLPQVRTGVLTLESLLFVRLEQGEAMWFHFRLDDLST